MAAAEGRFVTLAVLGGVCLLGAVLTSWLLGESAVLFVVVFAGLVVVGLIRPPQPPEQVSGAAGCRTRPG